MLDVKVFHLLHRELNRLERSIKTLVPQSEEDKLRIENIKTVVFHFDNLLNITPFKMPNPDREAIWKSKAESAKYLLDNEGYSHIANIKSKNLAQTVKLTTNTNMAWYSSSNKNIDYQNQPWRESFSYDVFAFEDQMFMYTSTGWFNLNTAEFLKNE